MGTFKVIKGMVMRRTVKMFACLAWLNLVLLFSLYGYYGGSAVIQPMKEESTQVDEYALFSHGNTTDVSKSFYYSFFYYEITSYIMLILAICLYIFFGGEKFTLSEESIK